MTEQNLIILAIIGLLTLLIGAGVLPIIPKTKKYLRILLVLVGASMMIFVVWTVFSSIHHRTNDNPRYKIRQYTNWYFVDPTQCKNAIISGIAYTPEKLASHYECTIEQVNKRSDFIKIDCTKILNNIFYMVKGEVECGKIHLGMSASVGKLL